MKKQTPAKILAVVATLVLVAILLSQINLSDIVTTLTHINPAYIIMGFILYLCTYFFRALRFHILLNNKISIKDLFPIVCVHNMANNILPARTGELSYVYLSKKLHNISLGEGVASLMVARIFDLITICFFFFVSTICIRDLPDIVSRIMWLIVGLLVFVLLFFLALVFFGEIFVDMIRKVANGINALRFSLVQYLLRKGDETAQSIKLMKSKKLFGGVFVTSIMIWCFVYSTDYVLAYATGIDLPVWNVIFGLTILYFVTVLPVQSLGGFGTVESGWAIGFMLMGISKELAITSGFAVHIIVFIYFLILGAFGMWRVKAKC